MLSLPALLPMSTLFLAAETVRPSCVHGHRCRIPYECDQLARRRPFGYVLESELGWTEVFILYAVGHLLLPQHEVRLVLLSICLVTFLGVLDTHNVSRMVGHRVLTVDWGDLMA